MQSSQPNMRIRLLRLYLVLIGVVGWLVLAYLMRIRIAQGVSWSLIWHAGFFLGISILVGLQPVRLPRQAVITVGFAIDYSCLLIFGPALAGFIGLVSETVLLWRSSWEKKLFNQGQVVLAFVTAGMLYQFLGGHFIEPGGQVAFGKQWVALIVAGISYVTISSLLVSIGIGFLEERSIIGLWLVNFRWIAPRFLSLVPFGLLMAMVYQERELGLPAVVLFLVPLVGARYAFQGAMEMLEVHRETVWALSRALEAYDPYTRDHSELVTRYALAVGKELGLTPSRLEILEWASRLHDIGKCRQDWESIIRKPGKPNEREWDIIRQHPVEGGRLAEQMEFLPDTAGEVARIVRSHHERLDGSGYPDGLAGDDITLEARVLGVADAFEAMTARRAYKRSRSIEDALQELFRCAGTQFDQHAVEGLAKLWKQGELEVETSIEQVSPVAPGVPRASEAAAGGMG